MNTLPKLLLAAAPVAVAGVLLAPVGVQAGTCAVTTVLSKADGLVATASTSSGLTAAGAAGLSAMSGRGGYAYSAGLGGDLSAAQRCRTVEGAAEVRRGTCGFRPGAQAGPPAVAHNGPHSRTAPGGAAVTGSGPAASVPATGMRSRPCL